MDFLFPQLQLPSLNEIVNLTKRQRGGYSPYNELKRSVEGYMVLCIKRTLRDASVEDWKVPVSSVFAFTWYPVDRRTDPDNVTAGQKVVFDALVKSGVLLNDNALYVSEISHRFVYGSEEPLRPAVLVSIVALDGE